MHTGLTIFASQLASRKNNSWTVILEQVQKTTDIQVNHVSIYKIFWESATDATTEGLQCLKLTFASLDHAVRVQRSYLYLYYTWMKYCDLIGHLRVSKSLIPPVIQLIPPVTDTEGFIVRYLHYSQSFSALATKLVSNSYLATS